MTSLALKNPYQVYILDDDNPGEEREEDEME